MPQNFLEIENVTFAASDKNKVNNVTLSIENEGDIVHLTFFACCKSNIVNF